jgi:phospho-N-acetylmuramoyl-pentapeptide-transferase
MPCPASSFPAYLLLGKEQAMLLWMLDWLLARGQQAGGFLPLHKITARAAVAAAISFLRARFREPIKSASPKIEELHAAKRWTPTMGGLFIVAGVAISSLVCADLSIPFVAIAILLMLALTVLGAVDDLAKLRTSKRGLSARTKLAVQFVIATSAALAVYHLHRHTPGALEIQGPLGGPSFNLGWWFVPLAIVVLVGASNAVNLADGLDGLAGGCLLFATGAMAALTYASGHSQWARYLQIAHVPGASEMAIVAGGMLGAVLGFLWFNCYPASVFMGDAGSLPLGGLLGLLAIVCRQELIFVVVAGVFVIEAASVVLQVGSFKLRGRRLLLCAPLHHHFQFRGWPENKIVVRFWISAALAAIAGLGLVKLNARGLDTIEDETPRVARSLTEHRTSP